MCSVCREWRPRYAVRVKELRSLSTELVVQCVRISDHVSAAHVHRFKIGIANLIIDPLQPASGFRLMACVVPAVSVGRLYSTPIAQPPPLVPQVSRHCAASSRSSASPRFSRFAASTRSCRARASGCLAMPDQSTPNLVSLIVQLAL
jgi:hypothetical protein